MDEMYIKIKSQWKQSLRLRSRSMTLELGELASKLTIVSSEFFDKKNVNSSLNLKTSGAKITPLLKKKYALFFVPQVGGHFYQLGLLN